MTSIPLDRIGLSLRSHFAALQWTGWALRHPLDVCVHFAAAAGRSAYTTLILVYLHPFLWIISGLFLFRLTILLYSASYFNDMSAGTGSLTIFSVRDLAVNLAMEVTLGIVLGVFAGILIGFALGLPLGLALGLALGSAIAVLFGVTGAFSVTVLPGIPEGTYLGFVFGILNALASCSDRARQRAGRLLDTIEFPFPPIILVYGLWAMGVYASVILEPQTGVFAHILRLFVNLLLPRAFCFTIFFLVGSLAGYVVFTSTVIVFTLPPHPLLIWPVRRAGWRPIVRVTRNSLWSVSSVHVRYPFLVAVAERCPERGQRAIDLLLGMPPRRQAQAILARCVLVARECAGNPDLKSQMALTARLPRGGRGFFWKTEIITESVTEISKLAIRLACIERPTLREPMALLLRKRIALFLDQVSGFDPPVGNEFRKAATAWLDIADAELSSLRRVVHREATPQLFRAGDPVDLDQEAFIPRDNVVGQIEQQIMLSTGCPGLILYGRRRVGKSTITQCIPSFLPPDVSVASLSLQDPGAFTSLSSFAGLLFDRIAAQDDQSSKVLRPSGLYDLSRYLEETNRRLEREDRRLLIMLDEYESIDNRIAEGVFPLDLLATIRHSIQVHRRLTWVFVGSHRIDELTHAPWTSYLVSVRTIEVPCFTEAETHLLLTEPMKHSSLWEEGDPKRPSYDPALWGRGGIGRIHTESAGWPHLVQLIAETAVDLLNFRGRVAVDDPMMEEILDKAIVRGDTVLRELLYGESRLEGELGYIKGFRTADTQPPPKDEALYQSLRRREIITVDGSEWRLRVPLMQRWLRARG